MLSPTKPDEKTFEELSKLVQDHLNPEPSEVIQRYKFHSKVRSHGQSVSEFVAELRELSEKCKFGDQLEDFFKKKLYSLRKLLNWPRHWKLQQRIQQIYRAVQYINLGSKVLNPNPGKGIIRGSQLKKAPLMNVTDVGEVTNLQGVPSRAANATTVVWYDISRANVESRKRGKAARMHNHGKKYITLNTQKHSVRVNLTTRRRNINCLLAQTG